MVEVVWQERVPPRVVVDPGTMRFLALHEARAHAMDGRIVSDLGDVVLLHDPRDDDPFWNRLSAVRLPEDPEAFARRLEELVEMFATLGRQPHVWAAPLHDTPADLPARLEARGFVGVGHGLTMVLADPARALVSPEVDARVTLERH
ncbi:MAG TPA: hypothetical protein VEY67_12690, partial [Candidatus Dormibacteraeota bacterium]|nr:hypothetical protein [Candidatus Dormibacteraeota bacterium]